MENYHSKRVLVTGGAGYIGSHTCKALAKRGYVPVVYDNLVYGHKDLVKWGPLEVGDITNRERIEQVIVQYRPSAIIHFAAHAYVGESVKDPAKYYRNNVVGSLVLLEAMRCYEVKHIIFSSSCSIYGIPKQLPISENHEKHPISPYGSTKAITEKMLGDFDIAYGIKSISLRYFNAAGADPDGETGELHDPETHLIPLVLDVAAGKMPYVTIYGDDYDTPDGTCIRDFIHVTDLAQAHVLALKRLEEQNKSDVYNLGNGNGFSVRDVIETSREVTGKNILAKTGPRRSGDPSKLVADASKAKVELRWMPCFENLAEIIKSAWRWRCNFI